MATIDYADRKLRQAGFLTVRKSAKHLEAYRGEHIITVWTNPGSQEIIFVHLRHDNERDDPITDYSCGSYPKNVTQAIRSASH